MQQNQVILFKTDVHDFPLEIIDSNGGKWVIRKQLEFALGVGSLRPLHARLLERDEIKENIHFMGFRNDVIRNSEGGNPNTVIYSYRGIIRVAMASEGQNAVKFRDWAETVLYEVMTTGNYVQSDSKLSITASDREALKRIAVAHAGILEVLGITGNAAAIVVNNEILKLTGGSVNALADSGNNYLLAEEQEQLYTVTEIGKKVGLPAMEVNQRLVESGYQTVNGSKGKRIYELTDKGKSYGRYLETGTRHSNGQPARAVKWLGSVLNLKIWLYKEE